uniref:Lipid-binding serum glycoprotein N-terminal domain-containing protein n=1 Tax=Panagrolaimus sp. ES5 TaxID=591445 RepID=A0AC34FC35_9BILA
LLLALFIPAILCQSGEYNPELDGGTKGNPGIKARINQPGFDYFQSKITPLLEQQLRQAQIPPISQCLPQVGGCIQVSNLRVTNFQCPQSIRLHPAPPNQIVITIENVGVSVTGNLNGQITILQPIRLFGQIIANANQISITVGLSITRNQDGSPFVQVSRCNAVVRNLDIVIQNGGTLGDLANTNFRTQIGRKVRKMIPGQLCAKIPEIVNSKLNEQAQLIPQTIAVTRLLDVAKGALGLGDSGSESGSSGSGSSSGSSDSGSSGGSSDSGSSGGSSDSGSSGSSSDSGSSSSGGSSDSGSSSSDASVTGGTTHIQNHDLSNFAVRRVSNRVARQSEGESDSGKEGSSDSGSSGGSGGGLGSLSSLTKILDLSKLDDLELSVRLLDTRATERDYTIDLDGEFSQNGNGGTPFGAYPMDFPSSTGDKMAEALISDYTLNSLLYALHKKEFLSIKLDSETPLIGPLLKTTCSDDEGGLEDNGVEEDETTSSSRRKFRAHFKAVKRHRTRRQDDEGGDEDAGGSLADLGICLGDILPIAREKYPDKKVTIQVSTSRAPSLILSEKEDGTATINFEADAQLATDSGDDIGKLHVSAEFEVQLKYEDGKLKGHGEISKLNLTDPDESLGLTQDALDSLSNLGKDMIAKQANNFLEKGIPFEIPSGSGGLPVEFQDPKVKILDHAIHLESDFKISDSFVNQLGGGGGSSTCQTRKLRRIKKL